ncbi:MAG: serine protease inhibitor ecotin [Sphingobacteriaceae bacterium]|nr:serine protease inhibitor ecotin [Sphingobacteriaceae bacterium]
MTSNYFKTILSASFLSISFFVNAQNTKDKTEKFNFNVFPKAEAGFNRVAIQVPSTTDDYAYQVEVFVGKDELVDCNKHNMMGEIIEKELEGFGYNYYVINSNGESMSTRMACPNNQKTKKFITLAPRLMRYNSRMPIVFYVPNGFEVKYRILSASKTMQKAVSK